MSLLSLYNRFVAAPRPSPSQSLVLSQLAPSILNTSISDTPEQWALYESVMLSALRTGDDQSARLALRRLSDRFGAGNERVMALQGLYEEATASGIPELEQILKEYERILKDDPTNLPIAKRRVTLLSHLNRPQEAITALTFLLSLVPTDAESWAQLAQLYFESSLYQQAIFCLEEILLILPNAYNVHARLGEISLISAEGSGSELQKVEAAVRWYLRSIELCDGYLRGYYGLKLATDRLLNGKLLSQNNPRPTIPEDKVRQINTQAESKLQSIVDGYASRKKAFMGYDEGEIEAVRKLLNISDS